MAASSLVDQVRGQRSKFLVILFQSGEPMNAHFLIHLHLIVIIIRIMCWMSRVVYIIVSVCTAVLVLSVQTFRWKRRSLCRTLQQKKKKSF